MRIPLLALVLVLSACSDREASPTLAERAATLSTATTDTIMVEGSPQAVAYREIQGTSFPLPFEARVPEPMTVGTDTTGGASVRLTLGAPPADAAWAVVVLPVAMDEAAARAAAQEAAEALGTANEVAVQDDYDPSWALATFTTEQTGRTGWVLLGLHAGRFFYVLSDSAREVEDGFGPRRWYLLRNWRWLDDGTTLAE